MIVKPNYVMIKDLVNIRDYYNSFVLFNRFSDKTITSKVIIFKKNTN